MLVLAAWLENSVSLSFLFIFVCLFYPIVFVLLFWSVIRLINDLRDSELRAQKNWWVKTALFCSSPLLFVVSLGLTALVTDGGSHLLLKEGQKLEATILAHYGKDGHLPPSADLNSRTIGRWIYKPYFIDHRDGFTLCAQLPGTFKAKNELCRVPDSFEPDVSRSSHPTGQTEAELTCGNST